MSTSRKANKIRRRAIFAAFIVLILALVGGATVLANLDGSGFDTEDGNLKIDDEIYDWANVGEIRKDDMPSGQNDNSFTQGTKEDTAAPVIEFGSIPPNKSDLKTFGVYKEEAAPGKFFLHLFWTRVQDPSGTTNMDFEFNQNKCDPGDPGSVCSANGVTPQRVAGDLLIVYELARGGTVPRLFLLTWLDGSEGLACDASNAFPCWGDRTDLSTAGGATGSINNVAIPAAESDGLITSGSLSPRTFGEASVDLSLVFDPGACTSFGSAYLKSRSSDSFTSALKDFIAPQPVNISNCGTVTIHKVTDPKEDPNTTLFGFTPDIQTDPPNAAPFDLTDDGVKIINNVVADGEYTITEDDPTSLGFDLTDITCTASEGVTPEWDVNTRTVTFNMVVGGEIDCTFTNTQRGTIIVEKQTAPDGAVGSFDFTGDAAGTLSDGGQITISDLVPGTYTSTEADPTPAFDLTSIVCDDANSTGDLVTRTATFNLDPGETVKCTFTNTQRGHILVDKVTVGGDSTQFEFDPSYGDNFFLADADTLNDSGPLVPGSYLVAEVNTPEGWALTSATCDDGSAPSAIDLDPGETVTCTFTNTKDATLIVKKVMVGGAATFDYTGTPAGSISTDGGTIQAGVVPGTYSSTETLLDGWDLNSIVCDDTDSTGDVGTATATFNAAAGEVITCTFTNTQRGHIVVVKQTVPDGDPQSFAFTASYDADGFSLTDGQSNDSGGLVPGTYSVSETVPAGWDLTGATCDDNSDPASINLAAGETVTCTFTNTKDANIIVEKQTNPDGDPQLFAFTASYDADGFSLSDGQTNDSGDLDPGTYSVSETLPLGWDFEGAVCSDGSPAGAISLQAGETVTCVFSNEKDAFIIVEKQTDPDGDPQVFDFTASYDADGFSLTDGQTNDSGDLDPGTYSVSETLPLGWDFEGAVCSDGSPAGAISLQAGETVTCIFSNEKDAFIIVEKQTDPDGDPQLFDFIASYYADGFSLADNGTNNSGDLDPGTYSVSETLPPGWDFEGAACSDGSPAGAISLQAGETVTCVFSNEKDANIIVEKQTDPDGDPQVFDFTASYDADGFSLTDGQINNSGDLDPGTYSVSETLPLGWDFEGAVCSDGSPAGAISLQAGETVTCVFSNEKDAFIVVEKQTDPADDPQLFDFTASYYADGFSLADNGTNNSGDLDPGTYSVSEDVPAGWDLTGATCSDGSAPASIGLAAGETVTCTFTNTKRGAIVVVKETTGGDAQFSFTSDTLSNFNLTTVGGTAQTSFTNLVPGAYDVAETVPTGWDLVSATCDDDDGSDPESIVLDPGETVTCTFTNEQLYTAIVLVCSQATLDLHASDVTFGLTSKTSLGSVEVPELWDGTEDELMAFLCALGGAQYYDLPANPTPANPYQFDVHIPLAK